MKATIFPVLLAVLTIAACDTKVQTSQGTGDTVKTYSIADIAGDKTTTADVMRQSYAKGTFDDALALAMQDSALASTVADAVRSNPALSEKTATQSNGSSSTARSATSSRSSTASGTSTARKGDILDKAEETARKANERIDQADRVKKQAEEAKRKIDTILKP